MRRSKQDWQLLIEEQAMSGLSAAQFCRNKGINPKYFSLRKSQLSKTAHSAFVPVQLSASSSTEHIQIDYHGVLINLPLSLSPEWIADYVKQLSL